MLGFRDLCRGLGGSLVLGFRMRQGCEHGPLHKTSSAEEVLEHLVPIPQDPGFSDGWFSKTKPLLGSRSKGCCISLGTDQRTLT